MRLKIGRFKRKMDGSVLKQHTSTSKTLHTDREHFVCLVSEQVLKPQIVVCPSLQVLSPQPLFQWWYSVLSISPFWFPIIIVIVTVYSHSFTGNTLLLCPFLYRSAGPCFRSFSLTSRSVGSFTSASHFFSSPWSICSSSLCPPSVTSLAS